MFYVWNTQSFTGDGLSGPTVPSWCSAGAYSMVSGEDRGMSLIGDCTEQSTVIGLTGVDTDLIDSVVLTGLELTWTL